MKKRDEFNKLIRQCRRGKVDMIIVKSISRFARNTLDWHPNHSDAAGNQGGCVL